MEWARTMTADQNWQQWCSKPYCIMWKNCKTERSWPRGIAAARWMAELNSVSGKKFFVHHLFGVYTYKREITVIYIIITIRNYCSIYNNYCFYFFYNYCYFSFFCLSKYFLSQPVSFTFFFPYSLPSFQWKW